MIESLIKIESALKSVLLNQTLAADRIFVNMIRAIEPEDTQNNSEFIIINFQDASLVQEPGLDTQYMSATYSLSGIVFEGGDIQQAYDKARQLSIQTQTLLRLNTDHPRGDYMDLQLTGMKIIRDTDQIKPMIGFVSTYTVSAFC